MNTPASPLQRPLAIVLLAYASTGLAGNDDAWRGLVEQTLAETCAIRKLPIKRPVTVQPMTTFKGGYTKGIGSTVWEDEYADAWRDGWCAVGVYCPPKGEGDAAEEDPVARPRGLYDHTANVLYVDTEAGDSLGTVAHEFVHALQHQNFPALGALHLWYNRDVSAAGNTPIEGGAHVVGWSLSATERIRLCVMTPDDNGTKRPRWWNWAPDDLRAHEMFPHAFGPEIALETLLAEGTGGLDALLADPPLSTLAILRPEQTGPVDFIKLPAEALAESVSAKNCEVGLRNTAGAVGIWGLLRVHGDASEAEPPRFIDDWAGDRFAHLACPGENNDELAWVTRWRTVEAALEFAERFRGVAPAAARYGGVLGAPPTAVVRDRNVVVVTPGLSDALDSIAAPEIRTFSRYTDWIASGCFPQEACYEPVQRRDGSTTAIRQGPGSCPLNAAPPAAFTDWFAAIRRARNPFTPRLDGRDKLAKDAGRLGVFCATNSAHNTDLKTACRAGYGGVGYLTRLEDDADWRLLPYCLEGDGFRAWLEDTFYATEVRPFASPAIVPSTYGPVLAANILKRDGTSGLETLLAAPPLSTLQLIRPDRESSVDFVRMPRAELAERGCRVHATDSQGVLGIWNLLMDFGRAPEQDALPPFLLDWLGDRQSFIRCGDDAGPNGWVWMSRWRNSEAAQTFAAHYRSIAPLASGETGFSSSPRVEVDQETVWIVPPSLGALTRVLKDAVDVRAYADFRDWVEDGCFPQEACN